MYTEEILLKYLDDELSSSERKTLERHLAGDPKLQDRLEKVKEKRTIALKALDSLNPEVVSEVPSFQSPGKHFILSTNLFRYAAAAVLLIGIVATLLLVNRTSVDNEEEEEITNNFTELETTYEDLDCFISPNRCWNERKIPLITIKIQ